MTVSDSDRLITGLVVQQDSIARVLVVEQDPVFVRSLEEVIQRQSACEVHVMHLGCLTTTLLSLRDNFYDLILLDLDLPDSKGLNTAIMVLQQALDTPVVILTSERNSEEAWEATRYGAQDVVLRDKLDEQMLLLRLKHAIEQHQLRLSLEDNVRDLELSNGRFLSLVVDNADAIIVVDAVGIVRFVNPAAEELLECSSSKLLGEMLGIPLEGVLRCEIDLLSRRGRERVAEMRVMRSLWDGDRAYIATLRDITDRKHSERELLIAKQTAEQASAMKSQFLANMSHELRTPLNSIIGFSEMMLEGVVGRVQPDRHAEYLNDIRKCGEHLLSLINDLLDLSKAEAGMLTLAEENFNVAELIGAVLDTVRPQAEHRRIRLSSATISSPLWVRADRRMITQVLLNLLSNALKFTGEGGEVCLDMKTQGCGDLCLVVSDNGIGIPREQIPRAFAAFVQVENAYEKSNCEGTGLGLALTKRLVELHGGNIRLDSEEHKGTTVTVTLPTWRVLGTSRDGAAILSFEGKARCAPRDKS